MKEREREKFVLVLDNKAYKRNKKVIVFGQGQAASVLKVSSPNFRGLATGLGLGVMRSWS